MNIGLIIFAIIGSIIGLASTFYIAYNHLLKNLEG